MDLHTFHCNGSFCGRRRCNRYDSNHSAQAPLRAYAQSPGGEDQKDPSPGKTACFLVHCPSFPGRAEKTAALRYLYRGCGNRIETEGGDLSLQTAEKQYDHCSGKERFFIFPGLSVSVTGSGDSAAQACRGRRRPGRTFLRTVPRRTRLRADPDRERTAHGGAHRGCRAFLGDRRARSRIQRTVRRGRRRDFFRRETEHADQ